jgi:hypothetical protein
LDFWAGTVAAGQGCLMGLAWLAPVGAGAAVLLVAAALVGRR